MKYVKKIFQILVISCVFLIVSINFVYADDAVIDMSAGAGAKATEDTTTSGSITMKSMEDQTSTFIQKGKDKANEDDKIGKVTESISENFIGIGQILTFIGVGVLIAVATYLGIQYFISSPDKQGELKQKLIALLVSAVVIFGAYNIWKLVLNIVKNFD